MNSFLKPNNYNNSRSFRRPLRRFRRGRFYNKVSRIAKRSIMNMSEVKFAWMPMNIVTPVFTPAAKEFKFPFANGAGKFTIIGKRIKYKNLSIKGTIFTTKTKDTDVPIPAIAVRVVIYQLRQQLDITVAANVPQLFFTNDAVSAVWSKMNPEYMRILRDMYFTMGTTQGSQINYAPNTSLPAAIPVNLNIKINNDVTIGNDNYPSDPTDRYAIVITGVPINGLQAQNSTYTVGFDGGAFISFYDI